MKNWLKTINGKLILKKLVVLIVMINLSVIVVNAQNKSDWPQWRYDFHRSDCSPAAISKTLHLQWVHKYSPRIMVWDDPLNHDLMPYDRVFEPVVANGRMFIGFNDTDKIVALDTDSGKELWRYYTDGPVRLPCAVFNDKVYATSDDGNIYCLNVTSGKLVWKFQAAPKIQRILGNMRMISAWPARGGIVIQDGIVYTAASIFPLMGTFIYAIDAETGKVIWANDGEGSRWTLMPHHGSEAFAGPAPQGQIAISGDRLIVPCGRSVCAAFDKKTGEFLYYRIQEFQKSGGSFVAATDDLFFNFYREKIVSIYDSRTGYGLVGRIGRCPVIDGNTIYTSGKNKIMAYDISGLQELARKGPPKVTEKIKEEPLESNFVPFYDGYKPETDEEKGFQNEALRIWAKSRIWEMTGDASGDLIKAGDYLYVSGKDSITAIDVSGETPSVVWKMNIKGIIERLLVANGKLFAVTSDGRIMAFGDKKVKPNVIFNQAEIAVTEPDVTQEAISIVKEVGVEEGYAIIYGVDRPELLMALASNSDMNYIVALDGKKKIDELRRFFDKSGIYGKRISVLKGNPHTLNAPSYMANLTITNNSKIDLKTLKAYYRTMKPYGGKLLFLSPPENLKDIVKEADLDGLSVKKNNLLIRGGGIKGSGSFTHTVGDIANTGAVIDKNVKLPLGILWWGAGASNMNVLPRHAHGPSPQVKNGRLYIEGIDRITCRDVYTGRQIWQTRFNDMETYGIYYNESYKDTPTETRYNQEHMPGVNLHGTNYVVTDDIVYVINAYQKTDKGWKVDMADAATGKIIGHIDLPDAPLIYGTKTKMVPQQWGYIGVYKDYLIGGGEYEAFSDITGLTRAERGHEYYWENWDGGASKRFFVMDRHAGEIKWKKEAKFGFINVATAVGDGKIFLLDKLPPAVEIQLERKGKDIPKGYRLMALDLATGKVLWETEKDVFGSYLVYSAENNILLESTRPSRDSMKGETGNRMVAFNADTGKVLWDKKKKPDQEFLYFQFPLVLHDTIITAAKQDKAEGRHFNLLTGELLKRKSPITGSEIPLKWARRYGCNFALASENLITFRSGCAGFFNLDGNSGTGNFGGFKSGCSNSLIVADGVLSSPDYTRTCTCCYPNQTSLALVHMPEVESWTFNEIELDDAPIETIGLNFGAHGDRVDDKDIWWFEYPIVGGPSPELPVKTVPENPKVYRHHSMLFKGDMPWIGSYGFDGIEKIEIGHLKGTYDVRLFFAEPDDVKPGQRVFNVTIQDYTILKKLDVVAEAGKKRKALIKEFKNISADKDGEMTISFKSLTDKKAVISGIELIRNDAE